MVQESLLAFLERDEFTSAFALNAFEPGFDHLPFGRVDHYRYAGDIRLGGDEVQELDHRALPNRSGLRPC